MSDALPRLEPFIRQTAPSVLDDPRARLRATRWPDTPEDAGWSLGTDLAYLRELVDYWAGQFDWPALEAALGRLPRFRVALGGLGIHFVHARAAAPAEAALPLVLSHGWPDSFWRYSEVIPLLTDPGAHGADPADTFDVVVPDMPGYGYSDRPAGPPLDSIAVAGLWAELMDVLGYARFGAAGGDIGSHVSCGRVIRAPVSGVPTRLSTARNRQGATARVASTAGSSTGVPPKPAAGSAWSGPTAATAPPRRRPRRCRPR